ncbi:hypothetical protein M011DRAFT_375935, partial [Sporormia fimetaria CBS 119925]
RGRFRTIESFLTNGVDANAHGGFFGSALQAAIPSSLSVKEKIQLLELLIQSGADVNAQCGPHGSALMHAIMQADWETTKVLVEAGANVNMRRERHHDPMQTAGLHAHPLYRDTRDESDTPLQALVAVTMKFGVFERIFDRGEIAGLLLKKGADVNEEWSGHGSVLQAAAISG